jgi:hypothetical protein
MTPASPLLLYIFRRAGPIFGPVFFYNHQVDLYRNNYAKRHRALLYPQPCSCGLIAVFQK